MTVDDRSANFCIVGAGSSGLAALKALVAAGIPCDCLEREDDVGGNWYYGRPHSSVYASTQTISSKRLTEYVDYPMPHEWPAYPHHTQVLEYLRNYARHFGLYERIEFGCEIAKIECERGARSAELGAPKTTDSADALRAPRTTWLVTLKDGTQRRYRGVIVANGHNWDPRVPEIPGSFSGETLHAARYKTPDVLVGKRVLIVGAGNSGCDIAVEAAQHAARTFISMRRGYHYLPKFWRGLPIDYLNERLLRKRIPLFLRRLAATYIERISFGTPGRVLPKPDHRLFESHPIINSQLFYYAAHGRIGVKPDVAELCGNEVRFADGSREPIDLIVYATGYRISFPFLDRALLNWQDDKPRLFLNAFHPDRDDLFVIGLIQPDSGQFGLVDYQSRLVAAYLAATDAGRPQADRFRALKRDADVDLSAGLRYLDSPRHLLEVEHFSYRKRLQQLLAEFA
jgi:hypothetical protein